MNRIGVAALLLAAIAFLAPALAQKSVQPQPDEKTKVCHHCEWLAIQISDIDEKIASWQRQTASIKKYSNLSDPNIQNALTDIANTIANLNARKQILQSELGECQKRCAALMNPPPQGVMPGGGKPGGGGGGGGSGGTSGGTTGGTTPQPPEGEKPCPEKKPTAPLNPGGGNSDGVYTPPGGGLPPPPPKGTDERADWDHLLGHLQFTVMWGDSIDVEDVHDDIDDMLDWTYDDLAKNPNDAAAQERLRWLERWHKFFALWEARLNYHFQLLFDGKADCPPPSIYLGPLIRPQYKKPTEDSPFYNPGGSYKPYKSGVGGSSSGSGIYYPYTPVEPGQDKGGSRAPDNVPGPKDIPSGQSTTNPP